MEVYKVHQSPAWQNVPAPAWNPDLGDDRREDLVDDVRL
jgi:hypothetical protein